MRQGRGVAGAGRAVRCGPVVCVLGRRPCGESRVTFSSHAHTCAQRALDTRTHARVARGGNDAAKPPPEPTAAATRIHDVWRTNDGTRGPTPSRRAALRFCSFSPPSSHPSVRRCLAECAFIQVCVRVCSVVPHAIITLQRPGSRLTRFPSQVCRNPGSGERGGWCTHPSPPGTVSTPRSCPRPPPSPPPRVHQWWPLARQRKRRNPATTSSCSHL